MTVWRPAIKTADTFRVVIKRYSDGGVEHTFGPFDVFKKAEHVEDGVNINLDHEQYFTRIETIVEDEAPRDVVAKIVKAA